MFPLSLVMDDLADEFKIGLMGYCVICLLSKSPHQSQRLKLTSGVLRYGGGLHQWDVPSELVPQYSQTVYATMVNYGPTVFAIKAAILLFLANIFAPYKTVTELELSPIGGDDFDALAVAVATGLLANLKRLEVLGSFRQNDAHEHLTKTLQDVCDQQGIIAKIVSHVWRAPGVQPAVGPVVITN